MTRKLKILLAFLFLIGSQSFAGEGDGKWKIYEKGADEAWQFYVSGHYEKARPVFKHLAEIGHPIGQFLMGNLYYYGQGVPMDKKMAREYFSLAAEQGYLRAYLPLAEMLAAGEGGLTDLAGAYTWYNIAIAAMPEGKVRQQMIQRRDSLAQSLSPMQLSDAQKKSIAFTPKQVTPPESTIP